MTLMLSFFKYVAVTWVVAFPIGIYLWLRPVPLATISRPSASIGLGYPQFLLFCLALMYFSFKYPNQKRVAPFPQQYIDALLGPFVDLMSHLWIPVVILGTGGTAGLIRIMRANLLDELRVSM